jgi:hypothetical protein
MMIGESMAIPSPLAEKKGLTLDSDGNKLMLD